MYDFANSGYTTVVLTAVFNAYFVSEVAGNAPWATFAWTARARVSYAIVMVAGPVDRRIGRRPRGQEAAARRRDRGLRRSAPRRSRWAGPGAVALGGRLHLVSNFAFALGENIVAAFLPELARPEGPGQGLGLGMEPRLFRRHPRARHLARMGMTAQSRGSTTARMRCGGTMIITARCSRLAALPTFLCCASARTPAACSRRARPRSRASCRPRARRDAIATSCSSSRAASSTRPASRP